LEDAVKREAFDLSAIKSRLTTMESHESCKCPSGHGNTGKDHLLEYPLPIRRRICALEKLQDKRAVLESKFRLELIELEKKYLQLYQPVYEERRKIVTGEREALAEEFENISEHGVCEVNEEGKEMEEPVKGLPKFWLTALKNHPEISPLLLKDDEEALSFLQDIRVEYLDSNPGFRLVFEFGENDYFSNRVLTKEYHLENPVSNELDDLVYDHAVGSTIEWKEGRNLCFKIVTKTQRNRNNNSTRTVSRKEFTPSFFHFFDPPTVPSGDNSDESEADPDELDDRLQFDYELGDLIKSRIVPIAIDWYTGKALEYAEFDDDEEFDYDDEDDEEDDEDEDDEDDDDDDRHGSDEQRPIRGRARASVRGDNQQQCKQQ